MRHLPVTWRKSRGLTLIELMVGLVITAILVLGVGGFFDAAHRSNNMQTAISGLNANGRFGLNQIARDLRMAGYRDSNWQLGGIEDPLDATASALGDRLQIQYEGFRDCAFALAPAGLVTNTYAIDNQANTLTCNGQVIANNVENMRVYFGRDTDADNITNGWVRAGTPINMENVVAVRIHLLTVTDGNDVSSGVQAYYFDGATQDGIDDGQIRREYSTTIAVRNRF